MPEQDKETYFVDRAVGLMGTFIQLPESEYKEKIVEFALTQPAICVMNCVINTQADYPQGGEVALRHFFNLCWDSLHAFLSEYPLDLE